ARPLAKGARPAPPPQARGPSEAELSQRLARTKARSYGSTASVAAPLAERYVEHRLSAGDTLQGIALKYGVTQALTHCHSPQDRAHLPHLHSSLFGAQQAAKRHIYTQLQ
uniref:LysM and putative peptidoglycan-binding domain-containing protein 2 n=1 Tax=Strix occidentalis caurina TaxID=311401 RepID=A0A8D0EWC5_STROC